MTVRIFDDAAGAAVACARRIEEVTASRVREAGRTTVALSGGTTPERMLEALRDGGTDWRRVHWFWVDERCVPADDAGSNYAMARRALFEPAGIAGANIHRVAGELGPAEAAAEYCAEIRRFFALNDGELPVFDVVHLGMGPEGHTASLFPGEARIADRLGLAAAVRTPKPPPVRVTLLPGPILAARHIFVLAAGSDKAEAAARAAGGRADPMELPVALVANAAGEVIWFLDRAAGGPLHAGL